MKKNNETLNKSCLSGFLQKGPYHKKNNLWFLKMWFLISGFLLYTVAGKIIVIKTENAAGKRLGDGKAPVNQLRESCSDVVTRSWSFNFANIEICWVFHFYYQYPNLLILQRTT